MAMGADAANTTLAVQSRVASTEEGPIPTIAAL